MADAPEVRKERLEKILDRGVRASQHDGERLEFASMEDMQNRVDRLDAEAELAARGRKRPKSAWVMRGGAGWR